MKTETSYLIKSTIVNIVLLIIGYLIDYFLNVLLARVLSIAEYGDLSLILRFMQFCIPFILIGTSISVKRFLPIYINEKDKEHFTGFLRWNKRVIFITSMVLFVLAMLFAIISIVLDKNGIKRFDSWHPLIFALWLIPLLAIMNYLSSVFTSLQKYVLSYVPVNILNSIFYIILIFIASFFIAHMSVYHALIAAGLQYILVIAIQLYFLFQHLPKDLITEKPASKSKLWFKSSVSVMVTNVLNFGLGAVDLILLEMLGDNEHVVAHFAVILIISNVCWLANTSFRLISAPLVAPLLESQDNKKLQHIYNNLNLCKVIFIILLMFVICFWGKNILSHFGPEYIQNYYQLIAMVSIYVFNLAMGFSQQLLTMSQHQNILIKITTYNVFSVVLLDIILIPIFQLNGVIYATIIGTLTSRSYQYYKARKLVGIRTFFI